MEKIEINKLGKSFSAPVVPTELWVDPMAAIKETAEKVNEIIEWINSKSEWSEPSLACKAKGVLPTHDQVQWKIDFEKKHWGAMFECGDYEALLDDIQSLLQHLHDEIIEKKDYVLLNDGEGNRDMMYHIKIEDLQAIFTRYGVKS